MQWLSKKFLVKTLRMYFEIEDQSRIGVQFKLLNLFGKHSVVCQNLRLKPQVINSNSMMVIIQQCKIHRLQIVIDSSRQQLLSAKITGVHLSLKFNPQAQPQSPTKTLEKPQIEQFKKLISNEQTFQKIQYFASSPFKRMLMEQLLQKINVQIENVDVCLFYSDSPNAKCVGVNIKSLNICQRQVINRSKNGEHQKQQQIQCKFAGFGMYLGISVGGNDLLGRENFRKEVVKSIQTSIKKRFFLEKNQLVIYFNQGNNTLTVLSELIEFNLSALYIREFLEIINQVNPLLSKSPKIRPGQGKKLTSGNYTFSQGTAQWWKYIGMSLVQKIKQKQKLNIIQNRQYRLYLYCLLYCYTYGAQPIYLNYIQNAQKFKTPKHIMNSHKFIIEKIYKIQNKHLDSLQEMELRGFVSFLSMKPKKKLINSNNNNGNNMNGFQKVGNNIWSELIKLSSQKTLECNDVKKIKYQDIKKSKVFINFSNCIKFMTQYQKQSKNTMSVFLRLRSLRVNLVETFQEMRMHKEMYAEHPQHFHLVKKLMMESYYMEHIKNAIEEEKQQEKGKGDKQQQGDMKNRHNNKSLHDNDNHSSQHNRQIIHIINFNIQNISMQIMENRFSFTINQIKSKLVNYKSKIIDIKNLSLTNLALQKYSEKQGRIINVGSELDFRVVSVYVNFTVKTAQKLLMLSTLISDKLNSSQQKTQSSSQNKGTFINDFMTKKIKPDQIFSKHNQSIHLLIQSITLVTPAFDRDRIFHINLNKLQCDYPSIGTKTISLERIEVKRSSFQNLRSKGWKKLGENESIILQNDRSFTVLISESYTQKVDPQYFNFVKTYSSTVKNFHQQHNSKSSKLLNLNGNPSQSTISRSKIQPMIEHDARSVFNLIIPFLFVQLACEDVYYLMLVGKYWTELMHNPYIFKPKLKTKQALQEVNKQQLGHTTYQFIKQIQRNTKILFQTHITLTGFEFIFNGDKGISEEDQYTGRNRISTIMIDSITYDSQHRLKDNVTKIKIKNVYVRNMLGSDEFNIQGLQDIFKDYMERRYPLIHRKSQNFLQQSYLIMYNHYMEDFEIEDRVPFVDLTITNSMNIQKLKGHNDISVNVKAFQIFHEPKFFRTVVQIINKLSLISQRHYEETRSKFFQRSFIREHNQLRQFEIQQKLLTQNKQILYSKDFSVINSMSISLQKVNLIVLLQNDPVYCIALDSITVEHKTQSYITVYNVKVNQLYIMDVSITNGPHSMIIQSTIEPLHINFTQYNCQLLKQRYKRSALMTIEINKAVIHFLNKKIMEFINFINQLKQDILGKPQPSGKKSQKENIPTSAGEYPFCYEIIIVDSRVVMYRNSLSKQKMQGKIGTLTVTNYKSRNFQETIKKKTTSIFNRQSTTINNLPSQNRASQSPSQDPFLNPTHHQLSQQQQHGIIDQTRYQQMSQISQNHFKSFLEQSLQEQISDYIYIDICNFTIQGRHRGKDILFADRIHMTFRDIYFKVFIPQINLALDNDDLRLLIRLTEENFGQQDRFFHINPIFKTEKYEKFVTQFHVVLTRMQCYKGDYGVYSGKDVQHAAQRDQNHQQQSINILSIIDLRGKDVSFINGEKYDEIEIEKIFAQDQNMNPFIQRYNKTINDPIIEVKPKTIAHSQKYFSKLSKIFDLFAKIGEQGDLVMSDFDYKEEEIINRPDRGKLMKMQSQKATKCEKLMKWLRGMCDKCFWWTKREMEGVSPHEIAKALLDREAERRRDKQCQMIKQHTLFCNCDYNQSHIFSDKQMIRLQNKVSPQTFYPLYDSKYPNQIYFRMDMETTKDKKMYILAKDLIMSYNPSGGLLDLAAFFGKPYGPFQDYDPPFVASSFNNFRPAQMYMQLKDSKFQMKKQVIKTDDGEDSQKIQSIQKIVIFLDLIYNMQTMGDMTKGPGRSIKQADIILKLYHSICRQSTQSYIQLSNLIELIYRNQSNVAYKKKQRTRFNQNIILKPYFDKQKSVNFYIPAFSIKSLMEIYNANFVAVPKKQDPNNKQEKESSQQEIKMNRLQSQDPKSVHRISTNKQQQKSTKYIKKQQLASKIDQKKQKIKEKSIQSSITNRKLYLQSLCVNIQSKLRTSFIKFYTNNFMFSNLYENMIYTQKSKMEINSELAIDYWNLHLLEFQPFLEKWGSKVIMKNIKRENTLSKKIKVESFNNVVIAAQGETRKSSQREHYNNKEQAHANWLNLNLSMAFFHTYKQLQLKYYQGKDEREQECIDATFPEIYNLLKLPYTQSQEKINLSFKQFAKKQNFPQAMKNFFGRRFILQAQAIRKKGENWQGYFHQHGTVYNLYHSYFDHHKRKKTICYRTPFRILNCFSDHITVRIKIKHKDSTVDSPKFIQLQHQLKKGEYLALPVLIYKCDFMIAFEYRHQHRGLIPSENIQQSLNNMQNRQVINPNNSQQDVSEDRFLSAQYLMQIHSQKSQFRKDKNSKILKKLFSQDSKKDRFLDSRDILIESGKKVFALICTKSEYQNDKQKSKIRFYDTLLAIVTPIQLYNYCPLQLTVILNGRNQYRVPCNRSTYISSQLNVNNIHETIIQFREHILHRQFNFLKKQNENHTYYMQLDRMQSVNVRVIKQTTSTFSIEIFADWVLVNRTEQQFLIDHYGKVFPLDRLSTNSIAIENYYHGKKIELQISLYSQDDSRHFPYDIITNATQSVEIITLFKRVPEIQKIKLLQRKRNLKVRTKCCLKAYPFTEKTKQKQSDQIYKVYSFVMKIANYQSCKLTKTLSIGYKTKMKNLTSNLLTLYQYNDKFKIEDLRPDEQICIWSFDFLPEYFVIQKKQMVDLQQQQIFMSAQKVLSQPFRFDQALGKMFTIKFRENSKGSQQWQHHKNFIYVKIQIKQHDHCSLFQFTQISAYSNDQFPIYIHNTTQETIKIYQNGQSFYVKPRSKVPFSWSNLINNSHQIEVQINDVKKTYSFQRNQQFQPIIIKDQHMGHNKPIILQPKTNFHKEMCRIKYGLIQGKFETIIDIKENCLIILPGLQGIEYKFDMKHAVKMTTSAQSIQLNLGPKKQPLTIFPSNDTFQTWLSYLNYTINQDVVSKISFTIQTYKNSRLFFFHNVQLGRQNDYLTSEENYFIQNLYISVINDKPQQVILLYMGEITVQRDNRICRLGYDDYQIQKCDRKVQIKQVKINNQLQNAVNPVILTQIKKSKTPFISIITKKRNLVKSTEDLQAFEFKDELITHFESFRFFLDEAEAMVEASLIPKLLGLKNRVEKVQKQYMIQEEEDYQKRNIRRQQSINKQHVQSGSLNNNKDGSKLFTRNKPPLPSQSQPQQQTSSYQLYMSFLQIRPIKMTISVSFDKLSRDQQQQRMNMQLLNMLPVGIQNAIITIDSYMFHHIYQDKQQVMKQINEFYKSQLTKQVLINAGNLEFLFAVDLIKNLGIGVKNIFYDPIYEFASNKDIKNTTSTLLQGVFSFVLFIVSFFVKITNLVFKIFAILTFDTDYKAKREIFRKQIFKSPLDGAVFGGKYFWKIIKSVQQDFVRLPKKYYDSYSILGCVFGFILAILNIIPWMIKIFITFYDLLYVIGIGFFSWGHYQQNAMKNRSRPIRIFHKRKLVAYNLLQAKAHQIMREHNITLTQKQSILYVRDVDSVQKTTSYLILSDYSLLYCNNRLSIFDQIILYKVFQFRVLYPDQNKKSKSKIVSLQISLKSPNIRKFLFLEFTKYTYIIKFKCYQELLQLLQKLQELKEKSQQNKLTQKYDYVIVDDKKAFNKQQAIRLRKQSQPLQYKQMDYLQSGDHSEDAILEEREFKTNKKKNQVAS